MTGILKGFDKVKVESYVLNLLYIHICKFGSLNRFLEVFYNSLGLCV